MCLTSVVHKLSNSFRVSCKHLTGWLLWRRPRRTGAARTWRRECTLASRGAGRRALQGGSSCQAAGGLLEAQAKEETGSGSQKKGQASWAQEWREVAGLLGCCVIHHVLYLSISVLKLWHYCISDNLFTMAAVETSNAMSQPMIVEKVFSLPIVSDTYTYGEWATRVYEHWNCGVGFILYFVPASSSAEKVLTPVRPYFEMTTASLHPLVQRAASLRPRWRTSCRRSSPPVSA